MPKPSARTIVRFEISSDALGRMHAVRRRLRIKQPILYSRLIEWYAALPEEIRAALIGWTPHQRKVADQFLQQLIRSLNQRTKDEALSED